jgi:hypothetical protein
MEIFKIWTAKVNELGTQHINDEVIRCQEGSVSSERLCLRSERIVRCSGGKDRRLDAEQIIFIYSRTTLTRHRR